MIFVKGKKPVVAINKPLNAFSRRVFLEIRSGSRIIWTGARSCYGSGAWDNDKPWLNDDGWRNE